MSTFIGSRLAHFCLPSYRGASKIVGGLKVPQITDREARNGMSRYQLDPTPIGEGGFGKIRKGTDPRLERRVAVKTLDPLWAQADDDDKERFKREAKILAKLTHPNIPAIYDVEFGENGGGEFRIIFQYIDGDNLRIIMGTEPPSVVEARSWFEQISSALEHSHDNGIVHRDIKPENMNVTNDRRHCYLVDFGLALSRTDVSRLTPRGYVVGTPGYMSPEQEQGDQAHQGDDMYVLAMCLYEILCGHKIHPGRQYEDLNTKNESIPKAIDELILSCIEPNKAMRLRSATDFGKRLRSAFQTHAPLSEILSNGQLYEVIEAIRDMTPTEFMNLPVGQRRLILRRGVDVITSVEHRLSNAKADFFPVLTCLAIYVDSEDYRTIIEPAVEYGFARVAPGTSWAGDRKTREALAKAASNVTKDNHHILVETLVKWLKHRNLSEQENWILDSARRIIQPLMANSHCNEDDATELDKLLLNVNAIHRERQRNDLFVPPSQQSDS